MILRPRIDLQGNLNRAQELVFAGRKMLENLKTSMTFQNLKQLVLPAYRLEDGSSIQVQSVFGMDRIVIVGASYKPEELKNKPGYIVVFLYSYDIATFTKQWGVWQFDTDNLKFKRIDLEIPESNESGQVKKHPSFAQSNHDFNVHTVGFQGNFHRNNQEDQPLVYWSDLANAYGMPSLYTYDADNSFGSVGAFFYSKPYYSIREGWGEDYISYDPVTGDWIPSWSACGGARDNSQVVMDNEVKHYHQMFRCKLVVLNGEDRYQISYYDMNTQFPAGIMGVRMTGADFPRTTNIKAIISKDKILGSERTSYTEPYPLTMPSVYLGMGISGDLSYTEGPTYRNFIVGDAEIESSLLSSSETSISGIHHYIQAFIRFQSGWTWADQQAVFAQIDALYPNNQWDYGPRGPNGEYAGQDEFNTGIGSVGIHWNLDSHRKDTSTTLIDYDSTDGGKTFIVLYAIHSQDYYIDSLDQSVTLNTSWQGGSYRDVVQQWQRTGTASLTFKMAYRVNGGGVTTKTLATLSANIDETISDPMYIGSTDAGSFELGFLYPGTNWLGGHYVYNSTMSGQKIARVSCKASPKCLLYTFSLLDYVGNTSTNIENYLTETCPDEYLYPTDWAFNKRMMGIVLTENSKEKEIEVDSSFITDTTLTDPAKPMAIGFHNT